MFLNLSARIIADMAIIYLRDPARGTPNKDQIYCDAKDSSRVYLLRCKKSDLFASRSYPEY